MRIVVQRVKKAAVTRVADNHITGAIDAGLCLLVGIAREDTRAQVEQLYCSASND